MGMLPWGRSSTSRYTVTTGEIDDGNGEFVYDGGGRLLKHNIYNQHGYLSWYNEFSYDDKGAIVQVSKFNNEWDPATGTYNFLQHQYLSFTNNSDNLPTERITHERVRQSNQELAMTPVLRTVFAYDNEKNLKSMTVYPLVSMYGVPGKPSWTEEYRYVSKGQDPLYFGKALSSIYISHLVSPSQIVFAACAKPLLWKKVTVYNDARMLPPTSIIQNYTIRSGPHGQPERIKEVYVGEFYVAAGLDNPLLITDRKITEIEIEYIPKR